MGESSGSDGGGGGGNGFQVLAGRKVKIELKDGIGGTACT